MSVLLLGLLALSATAHAETLIPRETILVSNESRVFPDEADGASEKTAPISAQGTNLLIAYRSDAPVQFQVSYPFEKRDGSLSFNPIHTVYVEEVPAEESRLVSIDLTTSPAWSPRRKQYVLHARAAEGSTVEILSINTTPSGFAETALAALGQYFTDEPALLSSTNFLWGYRVLDTHYSALLGIALLSAAAFALILTRRGVPVALCCVLLFLLLYDARYSLDLLRLSVHDFTDWSQRGEYRQLGPLPQVHASLQEEREVFGHDMHVVTCLAGTDFLYKQLRYMLYPTPVEQPGSGWEKATHVVVLGTDESLSAENTIACGQDPRYADLLEEYPKGVRLFRLSDT